MRATTPAAFDIRLDAVRPILGVGLAMKARRAVLPLDPHPNAIGDVTVSANAFLDGGHVLA